jgi:hypothetical protein
MHPEIGHVNKSSGSCGSTLGAKVRIATVVGIFAIVNAPESECGITCKLLSTLSYAALLQCTENASHAYIHF